MYLKGVFLSSLLSLLHCIRAPCCTFSQDTSLMAVGFAESFIRLWSLKGEKLKGMRSDFQSSSIKDCEQAVSTFYTANHLSVAASLRKIKEKKGSSTRKLIGHSGPVYSVAFDPLCGSVSPPKTLLSGSADGTARLWSLDTMTNVVAFRGHENPIWDVKWNPMGIYFATASRDKTARLWSTDRLAALRIYAGHLSDVDVGSYFLVWSVSLKLVSPISSKFIVSCNRFQRLDRTVMGRSTWFLCSRFYRPSRFNRYLGHKSGWALSGYC